MIRKAILGAFILTAVVFLATENSFAQRPIPGEMGGLLGVGVPRDRGLTNNNRPTQPPPPRAGRYTAAQIYQIKAQIRQYEYQINQWVQYRDQRVAPYYNHPAYYVWARGEYQRSNQAIRALQQNRLYYQTLLRQAGIY